MDIGLSGVIYFSHHYIPEFLLEPYIEIAGPAVTAVTISYLCFRGIKDLTTSVPSWLAELDWTSTSKSLCGKAYSVFSSATSWAYSFWKSPEVKQEAKTK